MKRIPSWWWGVGVALALWPAGGWGQAVEWGGILEPGRTQQLRFQLGAVLNFEGLVSETTRRVYEVTGDTEAQQRAQTLGTSDFNLEGPFGAVGLSAEGSWRFFRLHFDTMFLNPSVSTTAKRDYYLGLSSSIQYAGRRYDRLKIPAGTPFSAEVLGNLSELGLGFVPVGFRFGDAVAVNAGLEAGFLLFGGNYEIDVGESTEVVQYLNPPEDFVVGGRSSGFVGIGTFQWGPGVELRFGPPGGVMGEIRAHYLFFDYSGSTAFFTSADHRDKDLDFEHRQLRLRAQVEWPMRYGAWTVGIQARFVDASGLVSSSATDPDEILARRERFDKEFNFTLDSVMATIGLAF